MKKTLKMLPKTNIALPFDQQYFSDAEQVTMH